MTMIVLSNGTVEDRRALPPERRSEPHEDYDEGILTRYQPVTTLRRQAIRLAAEIVRIDTCCNDDRWEPSYQIRLIDLSRRASDRDGAVASIEYHPGNRRAGDYGELLALLHDVEAYVEWADRQAQTSSSPRLSPHRPIGPEDV